MTLDDGGSERVILLPLCGSPMTRWLPRGFGVTLLPLCDHDWDHALGGLHELAWEGFELVGHASVVGRRLLHAGRTLRVGYVEGSGGARTGAAGTTRRRCCTRWSACSVARRTSPR